MTTSRPRTSLDHIALAVLDIDATLDVLRSSLGATIISGDQVPGYRFAMLRVGDAEVGMNLELLEPHQTEQDDFLQRFLERHGEGPHHITLMHPDAPHAVARLGELGYDMVRTRLDFGPWQESFLHPRHGAGTVIQVAGSTVQTPPMADLLTAARSGEPPPSVPYDARSQDSFWWAARHPPLATATPAVLERVVVAVADRDLVTELFVDLFEGEIVEEADEAIEVAWGSTGRIRFTHASEPHVEALEVAGLEHELSIGSARLTGSSPGVRTCTSDLR